MIFKIKRFFKNLIRAFKYAKHGFSSQDWDYVYLIDDITFKLKLMEKELFENGVAQHCRITRKSLRRTIELGEILSSNTSKDRNFIKESEKIVEKELSEDGFFIITRTSPEFKLAMRLQHQQDKYNYDMFFKLLKKYSQYWWD